jgi:hypothetical protein
MGNNLARMVVCGLVAVTVAMELAACTATRLDGIWKDPGYGGGPFNQVAVVVLGTDEAVGRLAEDEFVRRLPMSTRGIASYGLVPAAERGNADKVRARLRAGAFDGVIVARLAGVEGTPTWGAGSIERVPISYRTLGDYYASTYQELERPTYVRRARTVRVQTNVYAVASETLVWSAVSQTFNPEATREVAGDVAKIVVEQLRDAGILAGN